MLNPEADDFAYIFNLTYAYRTLVRRAYHRTNLPKPYISVEALMAWMSELKTAGKSLPESPTHQKTRKQLIGTFHLFLQKDLPAATLQQFAALSKSAKTFATFQQLDDIIQQGLKLSETK